MSHRGRSKSGILFPMKIQAYKKIKLNKEVIFTPLDESEGIVIDVSRARYYILNRTAWRIWRMIAGGTFLRDVAKSRPADNSSAFQRKQCVDIERLIGKMARLKLIALR